MHPEEVSLFIRESAVCWYSVVIVDRTGSLGIFMNALIDEVSLFAVWPWCPWLPRRGRVQLRG